MTHLSEADQKALLKIARDALIRFFDKEQSSLSAKELINNVESDILKEERSSFVTLKKAGELRGCIGHTEPISALCSEVNDLTILAGFNDWRFPAIREEELSEIKIEISVLTAPKLVMDVKEIKIGEHGLIIEKGFMGNKGLLLPQVATEHGWDLNMFLEQVCRKAGIRVNDWNSPDTNLYTFTAQVFSEE